MSIHNPPGIPKAASLTAGDSERHRSWRAEDTPPSMSVGELMIYMPSDEDNTPQNKSSTKVVDGHQPAHSSFLRSPSEKGSMRSPSGRMNNKHNVAQNWGLAAPPKPTSPKSKKSKKDKSPKSKKNEHQFDNSGGSLSTESDPRATDRATRTMPVPDKEVVQSMILLSNPSKQDSISGIEQSVEGGKASPISSIEYVAPNNNINMDAAAPLSNKNNVFSSDENNNDRDHLVVPEARATTGSKKNASVHISPTDIRVPSSFTSKNISKGEQGEQAFLESKSSRTSKESHSKNENMNGNGEASSRGQPGSAWSWGANTDGAKTDSSNTNNQNGTNRTNLSEAGVVEENKKSKTIDTRISKVEVAEDTRVTWEMKAMEVAKGRDTSNSAALENHVVSLLDRCVAEAGIAGHFEVFGSFKTGFDSNRSDIDVTFVFDDEFLPWREAFAKLAQAIEKTGLFHNITKVQHAQSPLIRCFDKEMNQEVEILLNNRLGLRNSKLLSSYSKIDGRVALLVRVLKYWAKNHDVLGSQDGCINSYALVLLVVTYLVRINFLPNLQHMAVAAGLPRVMIEVTKWGGRADFWDTRFWEEELPQYARYREEDEEPNSKSLFALTTGFFEFYLKYPWSEYAVCLRTQVPGDDPCTRKEVLYKENETEKAEWYIEDPFDRRHNLAGRTTESGRKRILEALRHALENIEDFDKTFKSKKVQKYWLKATIGATVVPSVLLDLFKEENLQRMYFPRAKMFTKVSNNAGARRGYNNVMFEFASGEDMRKAEMKNETWVVESQLRLHRTTNAFVHDEVSGGDYANFNCTNQEQIDRALARDQKDRDEHKVHLLGALGDARVQKERLSPENNAMINMNKQADHMSNNTPSKDNEKVDWGGAFMEAMQQASGSNAPPSPFTTKGADQAPPNYYEGPSGKGDPMVDMEHMAMEDPAKGKGKFFYPYMYHHMMMMKGKPNHPMMMPPPGALMKGGYPGAPGMMLPPGSREGSFNSSADGIPKGMMIAEMPKGMMEKGMMMDGKGMMMDSKGMMPDMFMMMGGKGGGKHFYPGMFPPGMHPPH